MAALARESFGEALRRLQLPRSSSVVVGLSGGPDSIALTHLARQAFRRVVAVTVDHRLRRESGEEAERAGALAKALGVDHVITRLDWEKEKGGRSMSRARRLRYSALMRECERLNVDMMMVGHHSDDQIETMLCRLMMGSGVVGLGGMQLATHWATHPSLPIIRPLLLCDKSSLIQLCQDEGLKWIEDPSNKKPLSPRNRLRPLLKQKPHLLPGLSELLSLCQEVRELSQPQVRGAMERLATINTKYGTLTFDSSSYQSLNPYIARNVLATWLRYVSSSGSSINRYGLQKLHELVTQEKTVSDTNNNCILIPLPRERRFMIAKQKPMSGRARKTPIRVGETILWDNRFRVTLSEREGPGPGRERNKLDDSRVFFVRNFLVSDHTYVTRGVRKVKGTVLVHPHVRGGLPVVEDDTGAVALIPHFRVVNHMAGVECKVTFAPQWTMRQLLNFHYISDDSAHPS